jgi:hypothetical protein
LRGASVVSSTVRRTVVSSELSAPPPLIASATAAIDTLSGADGHAYVSLVDGCTAEERHSRLGQGIVGPLVSGPRS